jgi:hypothetical protein
MLIQKDFLAYAISHYVNTSVFNTVVAEVVMVHAVVLLSCYLKKFLMFVFIYLFILFLRKLIGDPKVRLKYQQLITNTFVEVR